MGAAAARLLSRPLAKSQSISPSLGPSLSWKNSRECACSPTPVDAHMAHIFRFLRSNV